VFKKKIQKKGKGKIQKQIKKYWKKIKKYICEKHISECPKIIEDWLGMIKYTRLKKIDNAFSIKTLLEKKIQFEERNSKLNV